MKILTVIIPAAILLTACVPAEQTCGPTAAVVISHTKTGFPIYDDQSPILPPCITPRREDRITSNPLPPLTPEPPYMPPVDKPQAKGNNGWGNGDQDAPGQSEHNNNAENKGGNHNGRSEAPARSWHD